MFGDNKDENGEVHPELNYKGKTITLKWIDEETQLVKVSEIKEVIPQICPLLYKLIAKTHMIEFEGDVWLENELFSELLYIFYPEVQEEMINETVDTQMEDMLNEAKELGLDVEKTKEFTERFRKYLLGDEE